MSEERSKIMDNLMAQDADLIDLPLQAAVRELLTDDSMEHLDFFTHNLVQAFDKHGLKVVRAPLLAEIERLTIQLEVESGPSPYCPICGSCGEDGCCGPQRCLYPTTEQAAELAKFKALAETLVGALEHITDIEPDPANMGRFHDIAIEALREYKEARDAS